MSMVEPPLISVSSDPAPSIQSIYGLRAIGHPPGYAVYALQTLPRPLVCADGKLLES